MRLRRSSVEELETLLAGTEPRTSHRRHAWRREAWKEKALGDFLERRRMGHHQSDEHRIRFKDRAGETSGRQDGALMGFSERVRTVLN